MANKFKVGDAVMISTSSEYYGLNSTNNPQDVRGVLTGITGEAGSLPYWVDWSNGGTNSYEASDLILVGEVKEKSTHSILVERSTLEVGDIVTVTHKVPDNDLGWSDNWVDSMDRAIGKECEVIQAPAFSGITLGGLGSGFHYPLQSVQLVRKGPEKINVHISEDYIAVVSEKDIKIKDLTITLEDFDRLVKAVAKMRK